ncbi:hypothetical protein [Arthrobacter sp. CJ23]|uniref:hypothetical protein n=1 Tax=Arthrobacter sp. CJ23 TaxID=2972479 RepID=UPI00215CCCCA|nr:hypothetical protein [Arthrobacter sp. CJ23]UVJ38052.1 hypothetical protein NVV90_12355 [Arthrobacter sp. CJ23]
MNTLIVDVTAISRLTEHLRGAAMAALVATAPIDLAQGRIASAVGGSIYDEGLSGSLRTFNICWTNDSSNLSQSANQLATIISEYVGLVAETERQGAKALDRQ